MCGRHWRSLSHGVFRGTEHPKLRATGETKCRSKWKSFGKEHRRVCFWRCLSFDLVGPKGPIAKHKQETKQKTHITQSGANFEKRSAGHGNAYFEARNAFAFDGDGHVFVRKKANEGVICTHGLNSWFLGSHSPAEQLMYSKQGYISCAMSCFFFANAIYCQLTTGTIHNGWSVLQEGCLSIPGPCV